MNGFYVSMIFFGVILVFVSLICIFFDRKKTSNFINSLDRKKQELVDVINDAEQLLEEMNRFSDYILSQIELKNEELNKNIREANEKLDVSVHGVQIDKTRKPVVQGQLASMAVNSWAMNSAVIAAEAYSKARGLSLPDQTSKNEKVIPFNNKYTEVLRLSKTGMDNVDIAKKLNMGMGEVELIIGLRKWA